MSWRLWPLAQHAAARRSASVGGGGRRCETRRACILPAVLDARRRDLPIAAAADVVFLHRGIFPFGPWQRPTFEQRLAALSPRIVYDIYDSIWVQREAIAAGATSRIVWKTSRIGRD